jgi:hypothetical protein
MFVLFIYIILIITLIKIILELSKNVIIDIKVKFNDKNHHMLFRTDDNVNEMKKLDKIYKIKEREDI